MERNKKAVPDTVTAWENDIGILGNVWYNDLKRMLWLVYKRKA